MQSWQQSAAEYRQFSGPTDISASSLVQTAETAIRSLVADVAASGASSRLSNRDRPVLPHGALCFLTAQQQLPIVPGVFSRRPSPRPVLPNGSATGGDEGSGRECLPCCHGAARCQLRTQTAAAIIMTFSIRFHEQTFDRSCSMKIVLFRRNRISDVGHMNPERVEGTQ